MGLTPAQQAARLIGELEEAGTEETRAGMARFGIHTKSALGVPVAVLRPMARRAGRDHAVAEALWASGIHEARILASMVDEPGRVTAAQMEAWARDFDSWDLVDQCCANLFGRTPMAYRMAERWAGRRAEFVKRAGYALMASLAVKDKEAPDAPFEHFLGIIERAADDDRNFVRKAVNWALRQIGKRNHRLRGRAVRTAERILAQGTRSARWIATDALRELRRE
ncbi:MAG TPA: DNA alkylation repair protein [Actinomycetota bacterium]|nr:DNA alkylation repair protein [Actinomycetota bacterium]